MVSVFFFVGRVTATAFILAACACLFAPPPLCAQRFSERFFILNPLLQHIHTKSPTDLLWAATFQSWGGFDGYAIVRDDEHAWRNQLGSIAEIVRVGNSSSLALLSAVEHVANANNDIRFNPRAVWWEEGLVFTQRVGTEDIPTASSSFWQVGYYHRCKHEIDNLLDSQTERVLIYGSLTGKYFWQVPVGAQHLLVVTRADLYTIYRDYRTPDRSDADPSYNNLLCTIGANAHYHAALPVPQLGWYAKATTRMTAFGDNAGFFSRFRRVNAIAVALGLAAGVSVESHEPRGSRIEIGFQYEFLPDPEIKIVPAPSHLLCFGVTFTHPYVW
jgi:hypothetical protein